MGENTEISWTHHTLNPWHGCQKVSPACDNCYAELQAKRYGHDVWGKDAPRRFLSDKNWAQPYKWDKKARLAGERHRVFCASMADVFEDRRDLDALRVRLWKLITETPNLDWLLLTKRPQNFKGMLPEEWLVNPRPNVWLGTTAENQRRANERIPQLLKIKARVRFVSVEPMLGAVNLCAVPDDATRPAEFDPRYSPLGDLDWVIVGGESGGHARPMHPAWARALRDSCTAAGVAFHYKQWGEFIPTADTAKQVSKDRLVWVGIDGDVRSELQRVDRTKWTLMSRVGRKDAGRILDGRMWDEFPKPGVSA